MNPFLKTPCILSLYASRVAYVARLRLFSPGNPIGAARDSIRNE